MKKIAILLTAVLLSGCAGLLENPQCGYKNSYKIQPAKVKRVQKVAVIHYADGKSDLKWADLEILQKVADKALESDAKVMVYGHASHRTRAKSALQRILINLKVSNERAIKIEAALMGAGVQMADITTAALFDSRPLVQEKNRQDEAQNRRAEVYLYWLE